MANWVPDGAGGALFGTVAKYVPPPAGVASPALWGTEDHLRALFGPDVELSTTRRSMNFRFPSLDFWVDFFGAHFARRSGRSRRSARTVKRRCARTSSLP